MEEFHNFKGEYYNWEEYLNTKFIKSFTEVKNKQIINNEQINIIEKAYTMTENDNYAYREIHDAFEADDSEKAVLSIFSFFMRANSRDRDILLRNEDLCEFYRGLEKD